MITEQQILEILNLRESNIDGGETLGIHCIEYGNIAKAVLKLIESTPLSDQGHVWREIPVSERLPEREKGWEHVSKIVFAIDKFGIERICFYNYNFKSWRTENNETLNIVSWLEKHPPLKTEDKE